MFNLQDEKNRIIQGDVAWRDFIKLSDFIMWNSS